MTGPVVGLEELGEAAITAGGHQREELDGGKDVLFLYFQGILVDKIVHAIAMLVPAQIGQFFKEMQHGPGDPETVGYTNMHGKTLHLLWDVVGTIGNPSHTMVEMMCADSLTPGEWIFNVHYFANHEEQYDKTPPDLPAKAVEATVTARFKLPESRGSYDDFTSKFTFTREKQEKTMLRFVIDNNGRVVHSSINSNDVPLKRGWQGD